MSLMRRLPETIGAGERVIAHMEVDPSSAAVITSQPVGGSTAGEVTYRTYLMEWRHLATGSQAWVIAHQGLRTEEGGEALADFIDLVTRHGALIGQ